MSTVKVLEFMTGRSPSDGYSVVSKGGVVSIPQWDESPGTQPTEAEINTTASSQAFLDWEAENGGDPVLTSRRIVKEAIDTPTGKILLAFILELLDRDILPGTPAQVKQVLLNRIANGEVD